MKKGKMFKKSISCLLAALMIIASMPFSAISASAADNTLTVASNTILCAGDTDRWKDTSSGTNSKLQITNDGQAGNFSYAIWQYKISDLRSVLKHSDKQLESAKVSYVLSGTPSNGVNPKLTFAYSTTYDELNPTINNDTRTGRTEFIPDLSKRSTDESVGGTYRADCLKSWYGLNEIETKTVSSSQSLEVDYAAAINDAVNKGLDYFTVFAYQPQRANSDRNNTWSDINLYNRDYSISYTTKDAYTSTSSYSLTEVKKGALVYSDTNRWPGGNIARVVNDQRNDNCSIGYLRFSVSDFTNVNDIASAVYDFTDTIDSTEREAMGLTVSYATQNNDSLFNTYGNNPTTSTGIFKSGSKETANTDFINNSKKYFGLQTLATYSTAVGDSNKSRKVDLAPAIKWAVNANKSYVVIAFMLSYPGGSNENNTNNQTKFWSDTDVNLSSSALSITKVSNSLDVDVSQVKAKVDSFNGYSSSYNPQINSKNVEAHNVLYSQNGTDFTTNNFVHESSYAFGTGAWWASYYIKYYVPNMTLLYDGTQPYNTVLFNATAKDNGCKRSFVNMVYPTTGSSATDDSSDFALKQLWEGQESSFGVPTSLDRQVGYSSSTRYGDQIFYYDHQYVLKNKLYYKDIPTATLTTINKMYWRSRADAAGVSTINGTPDSSANGRQAEGTDTIDVNINIVNIKELKTIAENLKSGKVEEYNKLLESKEYYGDEAKVNAYLKAVNDVVTFNPNYYFSSSTNDYQGCANAIDALVSRYNKTKSELVRRYKVTFRYANNNIAEVKYANSGDTVSTTLPNTATSYSQISGNNVNHEKTSYSWTTATVASSDMEVKETVKTENVPHNGTYNKDVKDEEGNNSKHSFVCSDCNYSYTDYHNFVDKKTCTCGYEPDFSAYNNAAGTEYFSIKNNSADYDKDSYSNYETTVLSAAGKRNDVHSQKDIDDITFEILYAKALLKKQKGTVTLTVYDQNDQEITGAGNTYTKDYGTEITIAPETAQNVYKYVIEKDGATSEIYGQSSISYVVTGDATVKAYCNNAQSPDKKYTKVTFLVGGRVSDIKYVEAGETLKTSTANKLQFPFFTTGDWDKPSVEGSADVSSVTVNASLTPYNENKCNVHFAGGKEANLDYNTKVDVVADYSMDTGFDYALSTSFDPQDIIAYIHGTVFYVPARSEVYVIKVTKGESAKQTKINTVGTFASYDGKNKYVGFNCKFSLAKDCTPVEWGITFIPILPSGRPDTSKVFRVRALSAENEYTATLSLSKDSTKYSAVKAKAYLKYKDSKNNIQVIYGDEYTQAFATENKFGITDINQSQN